MVVFDLGKTYDVVMCLFSSIGYVKTLDRVTLALERFKSHTNDGGLILVVGHCWKPGWFMVGDFLRGI